jgi:glycosyltransferase involved in cell wall biosynthesis
MCAKIFDLVFVFSFRLCLVFVKIATWFFKIKGLCFYIAPNSILYLENFPIENAGYQYRAAKWVELLRVEGYQVDIWTLYEDKKEFERRVNQKPFSRFLISVLFQRFKQVLDSRFYETVIVRRELLLYNDYGDLFLDKLLLRIHPNAILDFDDDIAAAKNQPKMIMNWYGKLMLENGNKFNDTLRLYRKFIVASNYLKERVLAENPILDSDAVCVIPTCVDYDKYPAKIYKDKLDKITFGWIGGDHNYYLLDSLVSIFNELGKKYFFKLKVIGGTRYVSDMNFEYEFQPWSLDKEVKLLEEIDIGLMPLNEDNISKGKGGFKLLQYMSLGIVSIASNVGIVKDIVENSKNSFAARNLDDWKTILESVLKDNYQLGKIGKEARVKVISEYSFVANLQKYLLFIKQTVLA